MQLRIVYDQSELVTSALGGVGRAVLLGGVLRRARDPVACSATCARRSSSRSRSRSRSRLAGLLLQPADVGLNTMTLGGLAIAVGLLVDAAIIVVENIVHRLAGATTRGRTARRALAAAVEVGRPIAFATLIVIAVFLPLFGMTGIEGRMYQPLAAAVIAAMAASLVLALTRGAGRGGLHPAARAATAARTTSR